MVVNIKAPASRATELNDALEAAMQVTLAKRLKVDGVQALSEPSRQFARDNIGLGDSSTMDVGTTAGTVAAGDDTRVVNAMQPATYDPGGKITNAFDSANQDFLQSGTGATTRSVQTRLRDFRSTKDFGAVGNGVTNDRTAFINTDGAGAPFIVTPGRYVLGSTLAAAQSVFLLGGEVDQTITGHIIGLTKKQWYSRADRSAGNYTGTPTVYTYVKELASKQVIHNNAAGYQQSYDSDSGGRTSIPALYIEGFHSGYGDMPGISTHLGITRHANWASATKWTGRNSVPLYDGQAGAVSSHVNLYGQEYVLKDSGNASVAAIGAVFNYNRTGTNAEAYTTPWLGIRMQSIGSQKADWAYQVVGLWNGGVDFTGMTLPTSNAVMAIPTNGRIYMGADPSSAGTTLFAGDTGLSLGTHWIDFTGTTMRMVVSGQPVLQATSTAITSTGYFNSSVAFRVNGLQVVGPRKNGWGAVPTGTLNRATFDTATVTLEQLAQRVAALITDLHSTAGHGLITA